MASESRPLDFLYDPTYILTSKERRKAEKNAQNLMQIKPFKTSNNPLQSSSNLKDILSVQKIPADHFSIDKPSSPRGNDTDHPQSIIVQSRQKPSYFRGINRFKFHAIPITRVSTNFVASASDGGYSPLITVPIEKSEEEKLMLSDSSGYESNNIAKKQGASTTKKYDEQKINQIVDRLYYGYPKKKSKAIKINRSEQCTLDNDYTKYVRRPLSKSSSLSSSLPNVKNAAENRRSPKFDDFKVWTSGDEMSHHHQKSPNLSQNPLNFSLNSRTISRSDEKLRSHSTKRSTSRSEKNDRIEALREKLIFQSDCLRKYLDAKLKQLKIRHELDLRNLEKSSPFSTPSVAASKNHRAFAHRRIAKYLSNQKLIPNGHLPSGNDVEIREKEHSIVSPPILQNADLSTRNETSSETFENKNYLDVTKIANEASDRRDEEMIEKMTDEQSIGEIKKGVVASNFDCQIIQNDGDSLENNRLQANFDGGKIFAQKENQESIKSADAAKNRETIITPQWTIKSYVDDLIEESMKAVIKYQTCEKIANILMKKDRRGR